MLVVAGCKSGSRHRITDDGGWATPFAEAPLDAAQRERALLSEGVLDVPLREELEGMVAEDQSVRRALASHGGRAYGDASLADRAAAVDAAHLPRLKQIIADTWPGIRTVGEQGSHDAWLLVQHMDADVAFQEHALELMKAAAGAGDASETDLAYLTDRVLLHEHKRQRYGTQFETVDGVAVPQPMENPGNVDARRRDVGLGSMAEYAEQLRRSYNIPARPVRPADAPTE